MTSPTGKVNVTKQAAKAGEPIPVVYGRRMVEGQLIFAGVSGSTSATAKDWLHAGYVLCEGEIDAVREIYIDGHLAWTGTSLHNEYSYRDNTERFYAGNSSLLGMQFHHGRSAQTLDLILRSTPGWYDDYRLHGLAYIGMQFLFKEIGYRTTYESPYDGIPEIKVVIDGKQVADAKTFTTGVVTRPTAYEAEPLVGSSNPVSCFLDYLRNPLYGKGLLNDKIDFESFRAEAVRWETGISGSVLNSDHIHQCNAIIDTEKTVFSNCDDFLKNMDAAMPYIGGKFTLILRDNRDATSKYADSSTSVMTINENQILGQVSLNSESAGTKYNTVNIKYPGYGWEDEQNEDAEYNWPEPGSSLETLYLSEDNNRLNQLKLDYTQVTQTGAVAKIAQTALLDSRLRNKKVKFKMDASGHELLVHDIFTLQYASLGISGKFQVTKIKFEKDYTFTIWAVEHADNVYAGDPEVIEIPPITSGIMGIAGAPVYGGAIDPDTGLNFTQDGVEIEVVLSAPVDVYNPDAKLIHTASTVTLDASQAYPNGQWVEGMFIDITANSINIVGHRIEIQGGWSYLFGIDGWSTYTPDGPTNGRYDISLALPTMFQNAPYTLRITPFTNSYITGPETLISFTSPDFSIAESDPTGSI